MSGFNGTIPIPNKPGDLVSLSGGQTPQFSGLLPGQSSNQSWEMAQASQSPYVKGMISGGAFGGPNWLSQQGTPQNTTMPTLPTLGSPTGQGGGYAPGAAPDIGSLTQMINQLNLQGQQAANQGRIPGAAGLEAASSANIGSLLAGQVPPDVQRQIAQTAAERGISTGNDNLLQSLGLTSLGLQQTGQQNLTSAYGRNPVAPLFDPTTQTMTPAQAAQANYNSQRLMLDWYNAITGNNRANQNRNQPQPTQSDTGQTPVSWFPSAGGTPSPIAPTGTPTAPPGTTYVMPSPTGGYFPPEAAGQGYWDPTNPANWGGAPNDPMGLGSYNPANPTGGSPYAPTGYTPPDASQPGYWDFTDQTNYDPFSGYGG